MFSIYIYIDRDMDVHIYIYVYTHVGVLAHIHSEMHTRIEPSIQTDGNKEHTHVRTYVTHTHIQTYIHTHFHM